MKPKTTFKQFLYGPPVKEQPTQRTQTQQGEPNENTTRRK
jgi:hypothetical protein